MVTFVQFFYKFVTISNKFYCVILIVLYDSRWKHYKGNF